MRHSKRLALAWSSLVLAPSLVLSASAAGCRNGRAGDPCTGDDCAAGLLCDPQTSTCVKPPPGTDASGTDAITSGTDAAGPGTDATTPGTDAAGPGTDAAAPGSDAASSGCSEPPAPTDPVGCYQTCNAPSDCVWVDADCCCDCANGGSSIAINGAYVTEWMARQAAMCAGMCGGVGCLTVYLCPDTAPTCGPGGTCM